MFLKPLMYSEIFRSWLNRSYCFEKSLYGSYLVHVISSSAVVIGLFIFSFWTNMEEKQQRSSKKNKYTKPTNARAVALSPEPVFWLELAWKLLSGRFATVHLIRWLKRPPWPGRFSRGDRVQFYLWKALRTHFLNTYNTEDISWKIIGLCLGRQLHHTETFVVQVYKRHRPRGQWSTSAQVPGQKY